MEITITNLGTKKVMNVWTMLSATVNGKRYGKVNIEASYLAEGWIDGKEFLAKVTAFGRWENGWYVWENAAENGTPEAPYAQVYVSEL